MNIAKEYPLVVQQIHKEFDIAGEQLLAESLAIIEKAEKVDENKAYRLDGVGFSNNPLIKKVKEIEEEIRTPKQIAETVLKYKNNFPAYKYISKSDVEKICKKYNLVHGNTEQYIGFVPEKNLMEIETFKNLNRIRNEKRFYINEIYFSYRTVEPLQCKHIEDFLKVNNSCVIADSIEHVNRFLSRDMHNGYANVSLTINKHTELPIFDICAPKKDMISNDKYAKLKGLFGTTFKYIPDPVVLYPVEYGYIIVTAWGDEASDPLVTNEQMN